MSSSRAQPSWRLLSGMVTAGARCGYCGTRDDLVAHHRVPRRLGGPDLLSNLEPVCRRCHPRVEQAAFAEAELDWVSPVEEGIGPPARRWRPPLLRPY
jgi:5-methylcytosine-specific restriction endonuclease McrA